MGNDRLSELWNSQESDLPIDNPNEIITKAKKQRRGQYISITVMSTTVLTLLLFAFYFARGQWNNFTIGLIMMIGSLSFRVILEFITLYQKENQLVSLDSRSFRAYLKKHYKLRLGINYLITPVCFAIYVIGFIKLLPYFERELSEGFYTYILISGAISLIVLLGIVVNSVLKENRFLQQLNKR